jgi:hypothetical protein
MFLPPSLTLGCSHCTQVNVARCGVQSCGGIFLFFCFFFLLWIRGCWLQKVGPRPPKRYTHTLGGTHPLKSHYVVCQDQRCVLPTNHYRCVLQTTDHPQSPQTTQSHHTPPPHQKSETIPLKVYILPRGEASADGRFRPATLAGYAHNVRYVIFCLYSASIRGFGGARGRFF